jgi:hypothetical protein
MNDISSAIRVTTDPNPKADFVVGTIDKPVEVTTVDIAPVETDIQPEVSDARHEPVEPSLDTAMRSEDASETHHAHNQGARLLDLSCSQSLT